MQVSRHRSRRPQLPWHRYGEVGYLFSAPACDWQVRNETCGRHVGEGGVHLGSIYLVSEVGVTAKCNLDILESVAFTINSLEGGWIVGVDWNCTPEDLLSTGWLKKVNGVICAPRGHTCNGEVYEFFVVAAPLADGVHSVHKISDAGLTPHSPARLIFKGLPRAVMIRQINAPHSILAILPHAPLQQQHEQPDAVAEVYTSTGSNYAALSIQTADVLPDLMGVEGNARAKHAC